MNGKNPRKHVASVWIRMKRILLSSLVNMSYIITVSFIIYNKIMKICQFYVHFVVFRSMNISVMKNRVRRLYCINEIECLLLIQSRITCTLVIGKVNVGVIILDAFRNILGRHFQMYASWNAMMLLQNALK